jgi:hypothetical protein
MNALFDLPEQKEDLRRKGQTITELKNQLDDALATVATLKKKGSSFKGRHKKPLVTRKEKVELIYTYLWNNKSYI